MSVVHPIPSTHQGITMPATDMFWGDRYGNVTDPFGHVWAFATHLKDMTPQEMEEAAQTVFSGG